MTLNNACNTDSSGSISPTYCATCFAVDSIPIGKLAELSDGVLEISEELTFGA